MNCFVDHKENEKECPKNKCEQSKEQELKAEKWLRSLWERWYAIQEPEFEKFIPRNEEEVKKLYNLCKDYDIFFPRIIEERREYSSMEEVMDEDLGKIYADRMKGPREEFRKKVNERNEKRAKENEGRKKRKTKKILREVKAYL
jgi:hypothetical protein